VAKKLTKEQVKNPDQVKLALDKTMQWLRKNVVMVAILLLGFVGAGAAWSVWEYFNHAAEEKMQGELALVEKEYFEKKNDFKEAAAPAPKPTDKNAKKEQLKAKASGDLQKDYGSIVERLKSIVDKEPKSKAATMAALYLAEIYSEYKKPQEAVDVLNQVSGDKARDVLSALVINLKAGLLADQGDCQKAIGIWQNVTEQKKVAYLHDEAKLRMALCYEKMNDTDKAEQIYSELSRNEEGGDRAVADDAKKYLRLMKIRPSGGT
jgi:tetratricopeptide (TPR) repeat protein